MSAPTPCEDGTIPDHPTDLLIALIVAFLTPMFLSASCGNVEMAGMAALETVNAYRVRNQADLLAVAQIIAFSLAALGSLSQSMQDDVSIPMALRLRANANALSRSQDRLAKARADIARTEAEQARQQAETIRLKAGQQQEEATPAIVAETRDRLDAFQAAPVPPDANAQAITHRRAWASACTQAAEALAAEMPALPPAERREASLRAAALSSVANDLMTGKDEAADPPVSDPREARNALGLRFGA